MALCVDTIVLLRSVQDSHPLSLVARSVLSKFVDNGEDLCIFPQNIREFWNVATRPADRNGLGFAVAQVDIEVQRIEKAFHVLDDGLRVYREWRKLVAQHGVSGVQVHDCYIVAGMRIRGIESLITFNPGDFGRYGITTVDPSAL